MRRREFEAYTEPAVLAFQKAFQIVTGFWYLIIEKFLKLRAQAETNCAERDTFCWVLLFLNFDR